MELLLHKISIISQIFHKTICLTLKDFIIQCNFLEGVKHKLSNEPFLPKTTFLLCVRVFFCSFMILSFQLFGIDHKRNQKHKHLECIITFPIILDFLPQDFASLPCVPLLLFFLFFLLLYVFSATVAPFFLLFFFFFNFFYRKS